MPRKEPQRFAKVPMWWAVAAAKATNTRKAMVWTWLVRLAFLNKSLTFPLPNGKLKRDGVDSDMKCRALRELEAAGLITVKWRPRKTPIVTLVCL